MFKKKLNKVLHESNVHRLVSLYSTASLPSSSDGQSLVIGLVNVLPPTVTLTALT